MEQTLRRQYAEALADLELQTRYSLALLRGNQRAQALRQTIDGELGTANGERRERLLALRGANEAENPNISYGSIYAATADEETIAAWPMPNPDDYDYSHVKEQCERQAHLCLYVGNPGAGGGSPAITTSPAKMCWRLATSRMRSWFTASTITRRACR
mgnify:CR=1 FL=1